MTDCEYPELECDNMGSMGICQRYLSGNDYCPGEDESGDDEW
jgi:DNA primase large subunit